MSGVQVGEVVEQEPVGEDVAELQRYNRLAQRAATAKGADFIDVWPVFTATAEQLAGWADATPPPGQLWCDGAHLSELGDALMLRLVRQHLESTGAIDALTTYDLLDRTDAQRAYAELLDDLKPDEL